MLSAVYQDRNESREKKVRRGRMRELEVGIEGGKGQGSVGRLRRRRIELEE